MKPVRLKDYFSEIDERLIYLQWPPHEIYWTPDLILFTDSRNLYL